VPKRPEDVLARVRKLLALATSPNVHEAASAAAAAQALIARHRLEGLLAAEQAVEAEPITDGRDAPLEVARRVRKWKVVLAAGLAEVNGCTAYTAEVGDATHLLVAGRDEDRAAVAALWSWLVQRLEWLSATHGAGRSRDWHESFRIGAADAIVARLGAVGAEADAALPEGALVAIEPTRAARAVALERWAEQHLGGGRGRAIRVDARAWARGKAAGETVPLPER
jgi:hypothetical protein